ncbi:MAG: hypothetical protein QOE36_3818 [Gaiellaceae bacterium]|nr:hypothetical protein [Gaiellaceae bacterium]
MSIRFRLGDQDLHHLRFTLSPLIELVNSLHVLLFPSAHAVQHPWIREMRRLSPELKRRIQALSFLYVDASPDCTIPPEGVPPSFEAELQRLSRLDADTAAYELARPLFHYAEAQAPGRESLGTPEVRERVLAFAERSCGEEGRRLAGLVFEDPLELNRQLLELFADYWEAAFADEWARLEPLLHESAAATARRLTEDGLYAVADTFPELRVDREAGCLVRRSPHEHEVAPDEANPLLLVPSAYVWPHVRVNCDGPWPFILVYPAPFSLEEARPKLAPPALVEVLRALGDPVRLSILRLVAERDRTNEELATLVGLSPAGLSKHVHVLADAGLVNQRRDGWYVLYGLARERLATLPDELRAFVEPEPHP